MSTPTSSVLGGGALAMAALALPACDEARKPPAEDDHVACALAGAAAFTRDCRVERITGPEGAQLIVRHPDGGFRRFRIVSDGRGVVPADGSESARLAVMGDNAMEIAVGSDRYRLPATIGAGPR